MELLIIPLAKHRLGAEQLFGGGHSWLDTPCREAIAAQFLADRLLKFKDRPNLRGGLLHLMARQFVHGLHRHRDLCGARVYGAFQRAFGHTDDEACPRFGSGARLPAAVLDNIVLRLGWRPFMSPKQLVTWLVATAASLSDSGMRLPGSVSLRDFRRAVTQMERQASRELSIGDDLEGTLADTRPSEDARKFLPEGVRPRKLLADLRHITLVAIRNTTRPPRRARLIQLGHLLCRSIQTKTDDVTRELDRLEAILIACAEFVTKKWTGLLHNLPWSVGTSQSFADSQAP